MPAGPAWLYLIVQEQSLCTTSTDFTKGLCTVLLCCWPAFQYKVSITATLFNQNTGKLAFILIALYTWIFSTSRGWHVLLHEPENLFADLLQDADSWVQQLLRGPSPEVLQLHTYMLIFTCHWTVSICVTVNELCFSCCWCLVLLLLSILDILRCGTWICGYWFVCISVYCSELFVVSFTILLYAVWRPLCFTG